MRDTRERNDARTQVLNTKGDTPGALAAINDCNVLLAALEACAERIESLEADFDDV